MIVHRFRYYFVGLLVLTLFNESAVGKSDIIEKAMRDELDRSMKALRLENFTTPYFLSYRIDDQAYQICTAVLGALESTTVRQQRQLTVELRVGDGALDNSNYWNGRSRSRINRTVNLPIDDDYQEIRRRIWLATDDLYKQSIKVLVQKRAVLESSSRADSLLDFNQEKRVNFSNTETDLVYQIDEMAAVVRAASAVLKQYEFIDSSSAYFGLVNAATYYLNSEGTRYYNEGKGVRFNAQASTQAVDGRYLKDFVEIYSDDLAQFSQIAALKQQVIMMATRLQQLYRAPLLDKKYNGPVLFEGQAAAELVLQAFAPHLIAFKRPVSGSSRGLNFLDAEQGLGLVDRIGARILPRFLSVIDDPTQRLYQNLPLYIQYEVDSEGVVARQKTIIENGFLRTLLVDRNPVEGISISSGNRRGDLAIPSNLIIKASDSLSQAKLRQKFIDLINERRIDYGIVIRRMSTPRFRDQFTIGPVIAAYQVYADGKEVLIRNADLVGASLPAFKDIVAVGEKLSAHTSLFAIDANTLVSSVANIKNTGRIVSVVTPDLLFEELTLKNPTDEIPKLPVLEKPRFANNDRDQSITEP